MSQIQTIILGINFYKIANCGIGEEGVKHLAKSQWSMLKHFYMGNKII